ncbi:MAG: carbamoyl phosphate synthase small subunit [Candidatus Eisenbacteria bacterium]
MQALLALEDGRIFPGRSFGSSAEAGGEVVFSTAMTGYQEVLTDPSYRGQIVVFTAPHIGNYGIHPSDSESTRPWLTGVVVRELAEMSSHPRSVESLRHYLRRNGICALTEVDTRALTLHLRRNGSLRGIITSRVEDPNAAVERARRVVRPSERDLVGEVVEERLGGAAGSAPDAPPPSATAAAGRAEGSDGEQARSRPRIVLLDFGIKRSIVTQIEQRECEAFVLPYRAAAEEIDRLAPDGIVLSNGPGDPEAVVSALGTIRHCIDRYPTLAICLGHQLAGLALGARIVKLPFGHHGSNHPVQDVRTGAVYVTSQNHNYAVDADHVPPGVEVTHRNLNDGSIEGFAHSGLRLWSYQFHPEGAPGPREARAIFDLFVRAVRDDRERLHAS